METRRDARLRIGELSQRTGVSPELLRAWERRYELLKPSRSPGGFRLYSSDDELRIRRMKALLAQGVATAEAAQLSERDETDTPPTIGSLEVLRAELSAALESFDEAGAQAVLDRALASFSVDRVIADLLVPYLDGLGQSWERGDASVAQEHFASNLIRARMLALGRGWDAGYGPRALLACPEGELHDLGLVLFGVALARRGWRITFLGANTPLATVAETAGAIRPDAVVIAISNPTSAGDSKEVLRELRHTYRLILAGPGAGSIGPRLDVEVFDSGPVDSAEKLASAV